MPNGIAHVTRRKRRKVVQSDLTHISLTPPRKTELGGVRRKVFLDRYSHKDALGEPTELYPEQLWERVAKGLASVEAPQKQEIFAKRFYETLEGFKFVPGGRILSGAGTPYKVTYYNCFVIPSPHDSRGGIIDNLKIMVEIMSRSGGVGINLSSLRPRGARVYKVNGTASGPVNWAELYSVATHDVIQQGGSRRGALMLMLNDWHPDIEEFIAVKKDLSRINGANLSVCVSDPFMEAVKHDADWQLVYPEVTHERYDDEWDGILDTWQAKGYPIRVYKTVKARKIWDMICESAWASAEPGLHFIDRSNKMSNTHYFERLISTNPCLTADSWVHTNLGPRQIQDLIGSQFRARVDGLEYASGAEGFFKTAKRAIISLKTKEGYSLRLTADHLVRCITNKNRYNLKADWCEAGSLEPGGQILLNDHRSNVTWDGAHTYSQGYLMGLLIGDGTLKTDKAILSIWEQPSVVSMLGPDGIKQAALSAAATMQQRSDFSGWQRVDGRNEYRLSLASIKRLAQDLGMAPRKKMITRQMEKTSSEFHKGLLRGLFDTDGSVQGTQEKGVSVRLAQSHLGNLQIVQRMLLRLGIFSRIYQNRRIAGTALLPDGKGGKKPYAVAAQHELVISGANLLQFASIVGFADSQKAVRLKQLLKAYRRTLNRERFFGTVDRLVVDGEEDVYDVQVPGINAFDANGFYVHNCGEQPLGAWSVCNLGAMNLSAFVLETGEMDYENLVKHTKVAIRMLDNVVDATHYFFEENAKQQLGIRRTGLGTMGLGDALIKMQVRYGSPESIPVIEKIYTTIRDAAYESSIELAREKGPFPLFDKEQYLKGVFIRRLPQVLQEGIAQWGIRNAVVLTQAPTGTTSLFAGVSSGIEPVYDFAMIRRDRTGEHILYHPLYKTFKDAHPDERTPDYFVAANDLTPEDHVRVQATIQYYTDSSISKTVNAPHSHTVEDVKKLYTLAYDLGLKGVTYMRDGSREGVLSHMGEGPSKPSAPAYPVATKVEIPVAAHGLRIRKRCDVGNVYTSVFKNETGRPIEVFVTVGKSGAYVAGAAEVTGRLSSLALRYGASVEEVADELIGISCGQPYGVGATAILSLFDAVGKSLAEVAHGKQLSLLGQEENGQVQAPQTTDVNAASGNGEVRENQYGGNGTIQEAMSSLLHGRALFGICPDCQSPLIAQEGCATCINPACGFTKCE